tara:strand:- start:255 stop:524 length:270 start_codon:yes stop_codon:yes gene_type:complete
LSQNFFCFEGASAEHPIIAVFFLEKFSDSSRNPWPSIVQPGVLALGKNHRTTFCPLKLDKETNSPFELGREKLGALSPIFNNIIKSLYF